jgi:hypothetical protein
MLASITPLGERGRGSSWAVTVTAFALGATLGGVLIGALAGAFGGAVAGALGAGAAPGPGALHLRLGVLAGALLLAGLLDARAHGAPGPRRQVNERWLDEYRGWVYGLGFGAQLGLGVTTVITSAATYAALLAAALSGSAAGGALIGAVFGLLRGVTPLAAARVRTPRELLALHHAMARWRAASRWAAVALLIAAAGAALAGSVA